MHVQKSFLEDHVIDTDAAQAPEQHTGRSLTATETAKAAPTVDGPDQQQHMHHKLVLRRAGTNCDDRIIELK